MEASGIPAVERHGQFWLELAIACVLGLTAVATAWAAYQYSLANGDTVSAGRR